MLSFFERRIKPANISLLTGFIVVSVIAIMAVTCTIAVLSYKSISSLSTTNLLSVEKNQELKRLDNLVSQMRDLHGNVSDYVITGDSGYIRNTAAEKERILTATRQFSDLLKDGEVKPHMLLLSNLIARNLAYNENILKLYGLGGREIALEFIETGKASMLNDSIDEMADNIKEFENHELETSVKKYNAAAQRTELTITVAAALIIVLALVFMFTSVRNLQRRARIIVELEKAKVASEKAALLKSQFMQNMSHEIRTPLNSIIGFTNILSQSKMNVQQTDFVQTIKTASENLLGIVNDVLDFSKIEAGMMKMEEHEFEPREVLFNIQKLFEQRAKENNLAMRFQCEPSVPLKCTGDSIRLNQILVNLVGNAIKFTEKGSVTVTVKNKQRSGNKVMLEFSIKDTGVGIPADKLDRIFDRFEQIDNNASRRHYGTGLGLSIVKSLVELGEGKIDVKSVVGEGTEFVLTLQYKLLPENAVSATGNKRSTKLPGRKPVFKGRVLLVEDNPLNQKLAGFILNAWKVNFEIALNGIEACRKLKDSGFALVLMDIQMPEMDGYQATKIIREEMKLQVPIVALTAHVLQGEVDSYSDAGMNGYLAKPFKESELYEVLTKFLETETAGNGGEETSSGFLPVIDFSEVEKIAGGNRLFVKEMAEAFVSQIQVELVQLDAAYLKEDIKGLRATAHSMKSTVGYMGLLDQLEPILNKLERCNESDLLNNDMVQEIAFVRSICLDAVKQLEAELPEFMSAT